MNKKTFDRKIKKINKEYNLQKKQMMFKFTEKERETILSVLCFLQYPLININKEWTRDWVVNRIEYILDSTRGGQSLPPPRVGSKKTLKTK